MACGTKMMPMITPDMASPQTYSRSLYLGSQRTTGKNPVKVDRTLGTEQLTPCFSLDLRTETVVCRWRARRSRTGGVTLVTSCMVVGRLRRQQVKLEETHPKRTRGANGRQRQPSLPDWCLCIYLQLEPSRGGGERGEEMEGGRRDCQWMMVTMGTKRLLMRLFDDNHGSVQVSHVVLKRISVSAEAKTFSFY
ncbi:hypothetical protein EYF80_003395 [Liparis tanakae]|uniref:Uncharacterized protein n=1 Tax=Liparis tanakae TaxID=230148 RepID=A0A4Z2J897_9TELE|nr:hypothetical protein EYF80_003395 [Liparis tanakae]